MPLINEVGYDNLVKKNTMRHLKRKTFEFDFSEIKTKA